MRAVMCFLMAILLCTLLIGCRREQGEKESSDTTTTTVTTSATDRIVLPDDNWN